MSYRSLALPAQLRGKAYASFLEDLREYLGGFLGRTQPLVDLEEVSDATTLSMSRKVGINSLSPGILGLGETGCCGVLVL